MADQTPWPLPKFHFKVEWEGSELAFQEVSGLDMETTAIEYRAGNDQSFSVQKMPGLKKFSNITMKKGMFRGDNALFDWFTTNVGSAAERKGLTISLLNEEHNAVFVWTVERAFPVKVAGTDLKAEGNEVAVETIEIAHEGVTLKPA
ncbi:phage tail protein [Rhodovulum steppense]|uniref:Phage tail-like protein n=1 Tax=Rhodovulum steppense TaxID=540251 RepID=A0A4R1YY19_9RHOB|nr:phage tail protein [Rhodovulum steppense]TCM86129.1 phage tail-like protein [Rhodovulum steppense]